MSGPETPTSGAPAIDYDALAKQAGALSSMPDYDALAKQAGAISSTPPAATSTSASSPSLLDRADDAITSALAPNPANYRDLLHTQIEVPKILGRELYSGVKTLAQTPGAIYHAFADPATEEETQEAGGPQEVTGLKRVGLGIGRLAVKPVVTAAQDYASGKVTPEAALENAPEALGSSAGNVVGGKMLDVLAPKLRSAASEALQDRATQSAATSATKTAAKANSDFQKAIPPTKSTPYSSEDLQDARPHMEVAHAASPIQEPSDVVDALDAGIGKIENRISQAIQQNPTDQVTVKPLDAVRQDLGPTNELKDGFLDAGLKELEPYHLDQPMTVEKADRLRRQFNAENKGFEAKNNYDQATARVTDPAYAARESAADALRFGDGGIYDRLADRGMDGIDQLRQQEGSLIKVRNAAQNQVLNGEKNVGGTGANSIKGKMGRSAVQVATTGGGAALGGAIGGGPGAAAGGIVGAGLGEAINRAAFPVNLSRNELLQRSFSKPITQGVSLPDLPARSPILGLLKSAPVQLPASTMENPPSAAPVYDRATTPLRKGRLLPAPLPQLPDLGYTQPAGEPIGTPIGETAYGGRARTAPPTLDARTGQAVESPQTLFPRNRVDTRRNGVTLRNGASLGNPTETAVQPGTTGVGQALHESPAAGGGASTGANAGARTTIPVPGEDQSYPATYQVRELADLQASHSGVTFQPNEKYSLSNDRDYSNTLNQGKVITNAAPGKFDPTYHLTDNPDSSNGPPVIDSKNQVLSGNGRTMMLQRVAQSNPEGRAAYRAQLMSKAAQFGLDPNIISGMKDPVLVRQVADADLLNKQNAITDFNKSGTAQMTPAERAIADSRRVSSDTLDNIAGRVEAAGPDATLADILKGQSGGQVLDRLIQDGVLTPQERAAYANAEGLTQAGKERISKLVIGRFFRDPIQVDSTPPSVRNKLEAIAAPLARVDGIQGWDLTGKTQEALDLLEEARMHNITNVDDLLSQGGLWGESRYSPDAVTLAKHLQSMPGRTLAKSLRQYAQDAADSQRPLLLGNKVTPEQAFAEAFADKPVATEDEASSEIRPH